MRLEKFNLEKAKAGRQVYTRDGNKVRIICYDMKGPRPIGVLVEHENNYEMFNSYSNEGRFYSEIDDMDSTQDLMLESDEIPSVWVARDSNGDLFAYNMKPDRGDGVNVKKQKDWHCASDGEYMNIPEELFPEIKNEDEEPR